ncbi:unnamed protein product [Amoebophrya sp. A25]|nr:unnamed protein product [Amoebophrya sp. A25]|eukprot:GSA25T00000026001.1
MLSSRSIVLLLVGSAAQVRAMEAESGHAVAAPAPAKAIAGKAPGKARAKEEVVSSQYEQEVKQSHQAPFNMHFDAPGFIALYAYTGGLILITLLYRVLVWGVCKKDTVRARVAENQREELLKSMDRPDFYGTLATSYAATEAKVSSEVIDCGGRSGVIRKRDVYQYGYGYTFFGSVLFGAYVLWLLGISLMLPLCLLAVCFPIKFLWLTNTLFRLDVCPEAVWNNLEKYGTSTTTCRLGLTNEAFLKSNVGGVFLVFFLISFLMWLVYAKQANKLYNFFMRQMSLREAEYISIEERIVEVQQDDENAQRWDDAEASGSESASSTSASSFAAGGKNGFSSLSGRAYQGTETEISRDVVENATVMVEDINGVTYRYVTFQSTRLTYDHTAKIFAEPKNEVVGRNTLNALHLYKEEPLTVDAVSVDVLLRGRNKIDVHVPSFFYFVAQEMTTVVNMWQIFQAVTLAFFWQVVAGGVLLLIFLVQLYIAAMARKRVMETVQQSAKIKGIRVLVYRDERRDKYLEFGKAVDMSRMDLNRRVHERDRRQPTLSKIVEADDEESESDGSSMSDNHHSSASNAKNPGFTYFKGDFAQGARGGAGTAGNELALRNRQYSNGVNTSNLGLADSSTTSDSDEMQSHAGGPLSSLRTIQSLNSRTKLRNGTFRSVWSMELVPGDLIEIPEGVVMPCDCVLLEGHALVNEADLTGEPMPVTKYPIEKRGRSAQEEKLDVTVHGKKHYLHCGTTVLQSQGPTRSKRNLKALGLVVHTGTATMKGNMIRKILYPSPVYYCFNDQLGPFIFSIVLILQLASTIPVVLYGFIGAEQLSGKGYYFQIIIMACFEAITLATQVVSPLMLLGLTKAQNHAADRLRDSPSGTVTLSPERITMAGEIKVQCLDKTGTITEEGLHLHGIRPVCPVTTQDVQKNRAEEHKKSALSVSLSNLEKTGTLALAAAKQTFAEDADKMSQTVASVQTLIMDEGGNKSLEASANPSSSAESSAPDNHSEGTGSTAGSSSSTTAGGNRPRGEKDSFGTPGKMSGNIFGSKKDQQSAEEYQAMLNRVKFGPLVNVRDTPDQPLDKSNLLEVAIATCHTVTKMDGKLYGNSVEREMVRIMNVDFAARIGEGVEYYRPKRHAGGGELLFKTVRQFEFDQGAQMQSVVVDLRGETTSRTGGSGSLGRSKRSGTSSGNTSDSSQGSSRSRGESSVGRLNSSGALPFSHVLFSKGSFEAISKRCVPGSLPVDAKELTKSLAVEGYYVIAVAYRVVDGDQHTLGSLNNTMNCGGNQKPVRWHTSSRVDLETDLMFLGLIYFTNDLKPDSAAAIAELRHGNVDPVMITGDNVWTGVHVAEKAGMLPKNAVILGADVDLGGERKNHGRNHGDTIAHMDQPSASFPDELHWQFLREADKMHVPIWTSLLTEARARYAARISFFGTEVTGPKAAQARKKTTNASYFRAGPTHAQPGLSLSHAKGQIMPHSKTSPRVPPLYGLSPRHARAGRDPRAGSLLSRVMSFGSNRGERTGGSPSRESDLNRFFGNGAGNNDVETPRDDGNSPYSKERVAGIGQLNREHVSSLYPIQGGEPMQPVLRDNFDLGQEVEFFDGVLALSPSPNFKPLDRQLLFQHFHFDQTVDDRRLLRLISRIDEMVHEEEEARQEQARQVTDMALDEAEEDMRRSSWRAFQEYQMSARRHLELAGLSDADDTISEACSEERNRLLSDVDDAASCMDPSSVRKRGGSKVLDASALARANGTPPTGRCPRRMSFGDSAATINAEGEAAPPTDDKDHDDEDALFPTTPRDYEQVTTSIHVESRGSTAIVRTSTMSSKRPKYYFALTEAAYRFLAHHDPKLLEKIFPRVLVFGRMTPSGKVDVIRRLQASGQVVGMCGDGGNDCAALRAAHAGVALADGDASIVAPFSSSSKSLFSVVETIRQGRCCLRVSTALVEYHVIVGIATAIFKVCIVSQRAYPSEALYLVKDSLIPLMVVQALVAATPPMHSGFKQSEGFCGCLRREQWGAKTGLWSMLNPEQPTGSLIAKPRLFMIMMAGIVFAGFVYGMIAFVTYLNAWYTPLDLFVVNAEAALVKPWSSNVLSTILVACVMLFNYFIYCAVSVDGKFRNRLMNSCWLYVLTVGIFLPIVVLYFMCNSPVHAFMRINVDTLTSWGNHGGIVKVSHALGFSGADVMSPNFWFTRPNSMLFKGHEDTETYSMAATATLPTALGKAEAFPFIPEHLRVSWTAAHGVSSPRPTVSVQQATRVVNGVRKPVKLDDVGLWTLQVDQAVSFMHKELPAALTHWRNRVLTSLRGDSSVDVSDLILQTNFQVIFPSHPGVMGTMIAVDTKALFKGEGISDLLQAKQVMAGSKQAPRSLSKSEMTADLSMHMCQSLCQASWEAGRTAEAVAARPESRFYCWWVAVSSDRCMLMPRTDVTKSRALGPDYAPYVHYELLPKHTGVKYNAQSVLWNTPGTVTYIPSSSATSPTGTQATPAEVAAIQGDNLVVANAVLFPGTAVSDETEDNAFSPAESRGRGKGGRHRSSMLQLNKEGSKPLDVKKNGESAVDLMGTFSGEEYQIMQLNRHNVLSWRGMNYQNEGGYDRPIQDNFPSFYPRDDYYLPRAGFTDEQSKWFPELYENHPSKFVPTFSFMFLAFGSFLSAAIIAVVYSTLKFWSIGYEPSHQHNRYQREVVAVDDADGNKENQDKDQVSASTGSSSGLTRRNLQNGSSSEGGRSGASGAFAGQGRLLNQ